MIQFVEMCSQKVLKAIHGSPIPCIHSTPDRLIWDLTANGMFTTRSAYQALQKDSLQGARLNWEKLLKWKVTSTP